jgi:hypothetical protein
MTTARPHEDIAYANVSELSSHRGIMSRTIDLPDEVYAQLEQHARRRGLTLPQTIAELIHEDEKARMAAAIARLRTQGVLLSPSSAAPPAPTDFEPIQVQGKPLSEVIIEERR